MDATAIEATTHTTRRIGRARGLMLVATAILATTGATVLEASQAAGFTVQPTGQTGPTEVWDVEGGPVAGQINPWLAVHFSADRSPDHAEAQQITVRFRAWVSGYYGWSVENSISETWIAQPGERVNKQTWYMPVAGGNYVTDVTITWQTEAGDAIAETIVTHNAPDDFICWTDDWLYCHTDTAGGYTSISVIDRSAD
jgi:hypothetical protein